MVLWVGIQRHQACGLDPQRISFAYPPYTCSSVFTFTYAHNSLRHWHKCALTTCSNLIADEETNVVGLIFEYYYRYTLDLFPVALALTLVGCVRVDPSRDQSENISDYVICASPLQIHVIHFDRKEGSRYEALRD